MRAALFTLAFIVAYIELKNVVPVWLLIGGMAILSYIGIQFKNQDRTSEYIHRRDATLKEIEATDISNKSDSDTKNHPFSKTQNVGTNQSIALFLRPFIADAIEVRNPALDGWATWVIPLYKFILPDTVPLDDALRLAMNPGDQFVAISTNIEKLGATKLSRTDRDWQEAFEGLVQKANVIVILVGVRDGTKWEIGRLKELGMLSKCIFLLFPIRSASQEYRDAFGFEHVRTMMTELGLHIPYRFQDSEIKLGDALIFDSSHNIVLHKQEIFCHALFALDLRVGRLRHCVQHIPRELQAHI